MRFVSPAQRRAVMARLRALGLLPHRQRQIAYRPHDIRREESWGDVYYRAGESIVSGPHLRVEDLPPRLYHVTTNLPRVRQSEFLIGRAGAASTGLGGGNAPGVSFTSSRADARLMLRELTRAVRVVQGPVEDARAMRRLFRRIADEDIRRAGLGEDEAKILRARADAAAFQMARAHETVRGLVRGPDNPIENAYRNNALAAFKQYLISRDDVAYRYKDDRFSEAEQPSRRYQVLKNPLLMGRAEDYRKLDPRRFGVVAVATRDLPKDVAITEGSDAFLREIRVHGDVPLRGSTVLVRTGRSRVLAERLTTPARQQLVRRRLRAVRRILQRELRR